MHADMMSRTPPVCVCVHVCVVHASSFPSPPLPLPSPQCSCSTSLLSWLTWRRTVTPCTTVPVELTSQYIPWGRVTVHMCGVRARVCVCVHVCTCAVSCLSVCLSVCRRSLAPHHNWLVRNTAYILMNFLPSKSSILQHLEGSCREIQEQSR